MTSNKKYMVALIIALIIIAGLLFALQDFSALSFSNKSFHTGLDSNVLKAIVIFLTTPVFRS